MAFIARKYLRSYRIWRKQGRPVRVARAIALFGIMCLPGGRVNLRVQNRARRYDHYWQ